ncbi:aldo/keto reductase family oxidoreductase [Neobacillus mesonae]|uniref:aldo/keto reductase n=1 Tax=Neobacillus mesonae TaxID=1193713 RepID=UPI00203FFFD0|nr:aldo/keto reductase [Neobacillus mesonae]MCM3568984.1 aldo/keto reductase [Neobacillus mesonae]
METIKLADDLEFSRVVLGFWRLLDWGMDRNELLRFVEKCMDLGITTFDHADIYGNYTVESLFGEAMLQKPSLREKMEIVTKCDIVYASEMVRVKYYDTSEEYIVSQVERSLRELRTDYIDLLLLHRPDPLMNPEEVNRAFVKLKKDGKVRHFGVSNYKPQDYRMLEVYLEVPLVTNQVEVSPLQLENFENGTINLCMEKKIHPMIWSPLAGGRIFSGDSEKEQRVKKALEVVRDDIGADSIAQVVFAWLYSHPAGMIPITGSGILDYVSEPISALKYRLTREQWFMIWTASIGHKVP